MAGTELGQALMQRFRILLHGAASDIASGDSYDKFAAT